MVHGRHQTSEDRQRNLVDQATGATGQGHQVPAEGAGVDVERTAACLGPVNGVDDEVGLALPASVERRLAGPRFRGHRVESEIVVADVDEEPHGGVQDLALALALHPGPAGPSSGGQGRHRNLLLT